MALRFQWRLSGRTATYNSRLAQQKTVLVGQWCVPVDPVESDSDPFLNTLFPYYADLVTDESVGPCPDCGIFTQTLGTAPNRQFVIRWKTNYFNSPPGPAQAEFEVLLTEGSNTLSVIYGVTGDNGLTAAQRHPARSECVHVVLLQ